MPLEADTTLDLEQYRGYLVLIAKSQWGRRFQSRSDPSDLVQQALLEAHQKRGDFKGTSAAEFACWLRTILAHTVADAVRAHTRAKRDLRLEQSLNAAFENSSSRLLVGLLEDPSSSPSSKVSRIELLNQLAAYMTLLPADQQQAIVLHKLQELSLIETAREMGRTVPAVAGLLRRGLSGLREMMKRRE